MLAILRIAPIVFGILLLVVTQLLMGVRTDERGADYWISYVAEVNEVNGQSVVNIYRMQPNGDDKTHVFDRVSFTHRMFWSSNGVWVYFDSRHDNPTGDIYRVRADGTGLQRLTNGTQSAAQPNSAITTISVINAASFAPSLSPDGKWIAFISNRNGAYAVYKMRPDGSEITRLADSVEIGRVTWSPDGQWLTYSDYLNSPTPNNPFTTSASVRPSAAIFKMRADGSDQTLLTVAETADSLSPAWSPDGNTIAFVSDRNGLMDLFIMDTDGQNIRSLRESSQHLNSNNYNFHGAPHWSPDGKWLAFVAYDSDVPQIYRIDMQSGAVEQLTFAPNQIINEYDYYSWLASNHHAYESPHLLTNSMALAAVTMQTTDFDGLNRVTGEAWAPSWAIGWGSIVAPNWSSSAYQTLGIVFILIGIAQFIGGAWRRHRREKRQRSAGHFHLTPFPDGPIHFNEH